MNWIEQEQLFAVTANTTDQTKERVNHRWSGIRLYVQVTAVSGTGGLRCLLQGKIPGFSPATYFNLNEDPPLLTATGIWCFDWYPGALSGRTSANIVQSCSIKVPYVFQILWQNTDATAYDYKTWIDYLI